MTEHVEETQQPGSEPEQDNIDALADALDGEQTAESAGSPELSPLEAAEKERDELRDKNLRLTAELSNVRRRADQEKVDAIRYAESGFAKELLTILDDLDRTLESANHATEVASVTDGVRIIHEHFLKIFSDHKIETIKAVGEPFNPDVHEALMQQPSPDHEAGIVMQEVATGYRMHDRVLRAARVIVSTGAPEVPADSENQEA